MMKRNLATLSALTVLSLAFAACAAPEATAELEAEEEVTDQDIASGKKVLVTEDNNGEAITLKQGQALVVRLATPPGLGWFLSGRTDLGAHGRTASSKRTSFTWKAPATPESVGWHVLDFELAKREGATPTDTFGISVFVLAPEGAGGPRCALGCPSGYRCSARPGQTGSRAPGICVRD
jgi:hypothetical protein